VLRDGAGRQVIVELTAPRSPLTIGRQPGSDIALTWDDEVSRAHAVIECIGDVALTWDDEVSRAHAVIECIGDVWTLVDDGRSRSGSFVNGQRVHGRRRLRDDDVIAIGHTVLTFVAPLASGGSTAVGASRPLPVMSAAQRRVLVALCRPYAAARFATPPSNGELAAELSLSVETIKFHLHSLFELFGLGGVPQHRKRATLAQRALEQGAITPRELLG